MAGQGDIALAGHSTSETPSATRLPCAVIIATKGRPDYARRIVDALAAQTLRPERVVVVGSEAADLFADDGPVGPGALQPELVLAGRPGLTIQRNAGLDLLVRTGAFADGLAFIAFFDDDFLPAPDWLEACAEVFADRPDVVGVTGHVLADGIKLAGYTFEEAESFLDGRRPPTPHWTDRPDRSETEGAYGCNMAFRAALTETLSFDEELPLYGWQEDSDYTAQVRRYGPVLFARTCRGVHMGTKSGRTSGVRMGYSQVANPIHIVGRGNMKVSRAAFLVGRALVANALKSLSPPEFIDYRGRLRGSAIALADLVRGRCRPGRILEL